MSATLSGCQFSSGGIARPLRDPAVDFKYKLSASILFRSDDTSLGTLAPFLRLLAALLLSLFIT